MNKNFLLGIFVIVVGGIVLGYYLNHFYVQKLNNQNQIAVATDTQTDVIKNYLQNQDQNSASVWKEVYDKQNEMSYKYIDNLYIDNKLTEYVHAVEWPPKVEVSYAPYVCDVSNSASVSPDGLTYLKKINDTSYCVNVRSEGAAGSTYTSYEYKKQFKNKTVTFSFVIRAPQCANFDAPQSVNCEKEKQIFNVDDMMDKIISTVKFDE